jgi:outer membrane biosynthesis protein TonB
MENVATYSEARSEYTKQLATMIVPPIVGWFQTVWARNAADRQRCLAAFQSECEEVSRWNQDRIHDEVRVLLEKTGCDYMEELMTAVFIAHTKVLTAVRLSTKQKKLSITVPKLDHFVHRVFRESARSFWKAPFLFVSEGNVVDRQKNLLQIEGLATEAITTAVRSLLPVKQILHDFLGEDQEEEEEPEVVPAPEPEAPVTPVTPVTPKVPEVPVTPKVPEVPVTPKVPEVPVAPIAPIAPKEDVVSPTPVPVANTSVSIETEPSVRFSDYDSVFDGTKDHPELRYAPKEDEGYSDALIVDEASAKQMSKEDFEDLEAPAPAPAPTTSLDDDVVMLD